MMMMTEVEFPAVKVVTLKGGKLKHILEAQ
jgi:hypothetical protein